MIGTPVRECRRGGIVVRDWVVGVRIRRRRGLVMVLTFGLSADAEVEGVVIVGYFFALDVVGRIVVVLRNG